MLRSVHWGCVEAGVPYMEINLTHSQIFTSILMEQEAEEPVDFQVGVLSEVHGLISLLLCVLSSSLSFTFLWFLQLCGAFYRHLSEPTYHVLGFIFLIEMAIVGWPNAVGILVLIWGNQDWCPRGKRA